MVNQKQHQMRNFINLHEIDKEDLNTIINFGLKVKADPRKSFDLLKNKSFILLFDKPSTRTRISFEVAISQLGGHCIFLDTKTSQLGRGESIKDTAKVMSRYLDGIIIRNANHDELIEFSDNSDIPVINALTDMSHPCQIMADLMTLKEHFGTIEDLNITWIGDGNNVANTWIQASSIFNFRLKMAIPKSFMPHQEYIEHAKKNNANLTVTQDITSAINSANCIVTDTWVSMNDLETERLEKINILKDYQVNMDLLQKSPNEAIFLHCLPAHRGEEVTDEVIDSSRSLVYDQAENRLHIQKAILKYCLNI
jgi:ornithine carbamoyltransferase